MANTLQTHYGIGPAVCIGMFPWRSTQERVTMPIPMLASPFTVTQRRPYGYHRGTQISGAG